MSEQSTEVAESVGEKVCEVVAPVAADQALLDAAKALTPQDIIKLKKALIAQAQAEIKALRDQTKAVKQATKAAKAEKIEAELDRKLERLETRKIMESRKETEARAKQQKAAEALAKQARLDAQRLLMNGSARGREVVQGRIVSTHKSAIETRGIRAPEPVYRTW